MTKDNCKTRIGIYDSLYSYENIMTYFGQICNEKWIFWNINGSMEANNLNHKLKSTPIETFDNDLVKLH